MNIDYMPLLILIHEELVAIHLFLQSKQEQHPHLLTEEEILADRMETDAVLKFLGMTINPFKEHVMNQKLFPIQTFGQRHIYSKQELLRLFVR